MGKQRIVPTMLKCTRCGKKLQICRKGGKQRPRGHIKHMYCPFCKKKIAFTELRDFDFDKDSWMSLGGRISTEEIKEREKYENSIISG